MQFDLQAGREQSGFRFGIVLSPKKFNQLTGFAIFCPITNKVKGYPFEIAIPDNSDVTGVILTDQVKSLDWRIRNIKHKGNTQDEVAEACIKRIHTFLHYLQ